MPRISKAEWEKRVREFREDMESGDSVLRLDSLMNLRRSINLPPEVKEVIMPYVALALKDQDAVVRFEALFLVPHSYMIRTFPELLALVEEMARVDPSSNVRERAHRHLPDQEDGLLVSGH